jgi:hypothetical protein
MRYGGALAFLAVTWGLAPACVQTVDLAAPQDDDAGVVDASADARPDNVAQTDASDGGSACNAQADAGRKVCRVNGETCGLGSDCCSRRCTGSYCLPSGTCAPPYAQCAARRDCCSGRCEPHGPMGTLSCVPFCQIDGAPCRSAQACCSLACNFGVCGGPLCKTLGHFCDADGECCSGACQNTRCTSVAAACLPTGEACALDGGGPKCCSGECDAVTGRCDLGPGACREPSSPCARDADCCRGPCAPNVHGFLVCQAACLGDGADCNSDGDCCSQQCNGFPSRCGPPQPVCSP